MTIRKHLTDEEFKTLKLYLHPRTEDPHATLLELIALTGLRQAEALALNGHSLDQATASLKVKSAKDSNPRQIPLSASSVERFTPFFALLLARKSRAGELLSSSLTIRHQARSLARYWKTLSENLFGSYIISLHGLRHSFVGRVFEATGNDLLKTQKLTGHKNINSTVRYLEYYATLDSRPDILKANGEK